MCFIIVISLYFLFFLTIFLFNFKYELLHLFLDSLIPIFFAYYLKLLPTYISNCI